MPPLAETCSSMRSEEDLRRRVHEGEVRLEAQLAVVVRLKAKGRPNEVAVEAVPLRAGSCRGKDQRDA
jgi:hypothetical protein